MSKNDLNEWITPVAIAGKYGIPVETIRRYLRLHSHHLKVRKLHKKFLVHPESVDLIPEIRDLYASGKNLEEVESYLEGQGLPLTVTVDPADQPGQKYEEQLQELIKKVGKQEEFNRLLLDRLDQQHKYIIEQDRRLEERDQRLAESLKQLQEEKQARLEERNSAEEPKKEGFFQKWFKA